jgi:curved DNA-binding protein CbpA
MKHGKKITPADAAPAKNPYEILGISREASPGEIRKAYLKKLRLSPPERDPEGFKAVKHAYTLLQDAVQRKTLDLKLFKKESGIEIKPGPPPDLMNFFTLRLLRFFLASSDFYTRDFSRDFRDITQEIKSLK